jgi:hypothetical protein
VTDRRCDPLARKPNLTTPLLPTTQLVKGPDDVSVLMLVHHLEEIPALTAILHMLNPVRKGALRITGGFCTYVCAFVRLDCRISTTPTPPIPNRRAPRRVVHRHHGHFARTRARARLFVPDQRPVPADAFDGALRWTVLGDTHTNAPNLSSGPTPHRSAPWSGPRAWRRTC